MGGIAAHSRIAWRLFRLPLQNYQGDWAPEQLKPYDLSDNASDAALVYFDTIRYRALGVPFHRLLLATDVDGLRIKGAGRRSILDVSGEQALKLKPGKHSLRWCCYR
ncbi:hypothetical protein [Pseudomonas sp. FEN]|uniref:hypothetical protein n=1 Tax=Pseudomonas sp. FEN TaxID=2767468 RepID=UPI001CD790DE|nr:hypothetical protein [Pseudomonas sp. FEN]